MMLYHIWLQVNVWCSLGGARTRQELMDSKTENWTLRPHGRPWAQHKNIMFRICRSTENHFLNGSLGQTPSKSFLEIFDLINHLKYQFSGTFGLIKLPLQIDL